MKNKLLLFLLIVLFLSSCSNSPPQTQNKTEPLLPFYGLAAPKKIYFLPECWAPKSTEPPNKNKIPWVEFHTIKEAESYGFEPAPCSKIYNGERLRKELDAQK